MNIIKKLENQRWVVWALVVAVVTGTGLITYVFYVTKLDSLESVTVSVTRGPNKLTHVATNSTKDWKRVSLPNADIVSLTHPLDWTLTNKSENLVELSDGKEKINVYYYGDTSLTNPSRSDPDAEQKVMDKYISSIKNINSQTTTTAERDLGSQRIENLVNGKKEIHTVFFIGTLLIDVYTNAPESSIYSKVVESFQYGGF